jgi:hypothetical protein
MVDSHAVQVCGLSGTLSFHESGLGFLLSGYFMPNLYVILYEEIIILSVTTTYVETFELIVRCCVTLIISGVSVVD